MPGPSNKDTNLIDNIRAQKEELAKLREEERVKSEAQVKKLKRAGRSEEKKHAHDEDWKRLAEASKELDERGQNGYDTWVAAMSAILMHCYKIMAVNPIGSFVKGIAGEVGAIIERNTGQEMSLEAFIDTQVSKLGATGPAPVDMADFKLQHFIEFTDQDTLKIDTLSKNLRRSDGLEFTPEQEDIFKYSLKQAMVLWMDTQGYKPDPGNPPANPPVPNAFVSKADPTQRLTKTVFEELRDDPARGLSEFFSGRFDVTFRQASGPRL